MKVIILSAIKEETYSLKTEYEIKHTGVGKVNAALSTLRTIKEDKPDLIINFGTAGSLNTNISGLVDCKFFIQRDMDSRPLGVELGQTPFEEDPPKIIEIADHPINTINLNLICATGDSFVDSNVGLEADVVDMEAYAIAKCCYQNDVDFVSFKYITDGADGEAANDWLENCEKGAKEFLKIIEHYCE